MKGTSLFAQIINHAILPAEFNTIVHARKGDKHSKGFRCWDQLVSMLFLHFSKSTSLREIVGGIRSSTGRLTHLRMKKAPPRSTLSYANTHRDWRIYQDTFFTLLKRCRGQFHGSKHFRFKNKLLSVDSTVIDLSVTLFDWAKFRQTKGAVKVHMLLDHDGYLPVYASIGEGKGSDAKAIKKDMLPLEALREERRFPRGSILAMDRAYVDFELFSMLATGGIFFVTRLKQGMNWVVVEKRELPENRNILRDDVISFRSNKALKLLGQHNRFRLIESLDKKTGKVIELLSNHLDFGSTTISGIYKDRWAIESFFRALKQNLRIKTFVGCSPNALKIQIWTALIAILLLKFFQNLSTRDWSLSNLVALLRMSLFSYRDLLEWLNNPFETPPEEPGAQLWIQF